mgnify:CR=1 FL=1
MKKETVYLGKNAIGTKRGNIKILDCSKEHVYSCECLICGKKFKTFRNHIIDYAEFGCYECSAPEIQGRIEKKKKDYHEALKKKYIGTTVNNLKILDVIYKKQKKKNLYFFKLECTCGNIFEARKGPVLRGEILSCGHDRAKNLQKGKDKLREFNIDGTQILSLGKRKINKNSTTGIVGVSQIKSGRKIGKYRAYINFRRKQYFLGEYEDIEDAKIAREVAEKEIHGEFLEWYAKEYPDKWEKIKEKAIRD